jgi:type I restriction enzyme S subunit
MKPISIHPTFSNYLLKSTAFVEENYRIGHGIVADLWTTRYDEMKNIKIGVPSPEEQTAIANFLDDKTAKIDRAIAQKEKMIALLKERKQIIIQNAVTKGLNPNAKMKDSGVEWIGEIPEGWEVKNLRYAFKFLNHRRIPLSAVERETMQGEYPYYGASGIIDYVNQFIFDEKTILIAEDGANLLSKSTPLAFQADGRYWVNNHAHILQPKYPGFRYWAELLSLIDYTIYISGAAQPKLSRENLGSVKVIVPPIKEIEEIVAHIETQSFKIDKAIALQQQQIEKLKELKSTLIDSAVTGKIKVS